jgi:phosphate transport system ATP-binding protein
MPSAFQLENVSCHYGCFTAVDGVSVSIESGERVAFIGPSGSGKTTLLRVMNTMRSQEEGTLSIFGQDPGTFSAGELQSFRSSIATIPQHLGLIPNLTAIQNVILGRGGKRGTLRSVKDLLFPSTADKLAIHELLERVGIAEKLFSPVARLSGGQQQRLCIARAIATAPEILLMDEPCSALDPIATAQVEELIDELRQSYSVVIVTHSMQQAARVSQKTAFFHLGNLVEYGVTDKIFTNPEDPRTESYISGRIG